MNDYIRRSMFRTMFKIYYEAFMQNYLRMKDRLLFLLESSFVDVR